MKNSDILQKLIALQKAVNDGGYNYEITLGFEEYSRCVTKEDFLIRLKESYPEFTMGQSCFLPSTDKEFWEKIDSTLLYEGDLKQSSMDKIKPLVLKFKQAVSSAIPPSSEFYHSDLPEGIPGYPVWWEFSFMIDTKAGSYILIYGSASD
ncbi:MAG: hypothetical protein DI535_23465 [Citrobacter freundii]|nr:MAG: hypothetical protein DI535_23465 [Citrobacter freundii]